MARKLNIENVGIIGHVDCGKTIGIEIAEAIKRGAQVIIVNDEKQNNPFDNTPMMPIYDFKIPEIFIEPLTRKERRKRERENKHK